MLAILIYSGPRGSYGHYHTKDAVDTLVVFYLVPKLLYLVIVYFNSNLSINNLNF